MLRVEKSNNGTAKYTRPFKKLQCNSNEVNMDIFAAVPLAVILYFVVFTFNKENINSQCSQCIRGIPESKAEKGSTRFTSTRFMCITVDILECRIHPFNALFFA